jgi:2-iminobutanoate/2-iminopropanoate deaminase
MLKRHLIAAAPPPPIGVKYHHSTEADGWLYVTGQLPVYLEDPAGDLPDGIEAQTNQTFRNLITIVEGSGIALADTVSMRIYLSDFDRDYGGLNRVVYRYFSDDASVPSRTTVGVARLGRGALVEIDLVLRRSQ